MKIFSMVLTSNNNDVLGFAPLTIHRTDGIPQAQSRVDKRLCSPDNDASI